MPKLEMSQDEIRLNGECYIPPQKIDEIIGREEFKQRLLREVKRIEQQGDIPHKVLEAAIRAAEEGE